MSVEKALFEEAVSTIGAMQVEIDDLRDANSLQETRIDDLLLEVREAKEYEEIADKNKDAFFELDGYFDELAALASDIASGDIAKYQDPKLEIAALQRKAGDIDVEF